MPVTLPATPDGVIGANALAAATSVDGTLQQQLDAAEDHNVAVAVDPRIIASIRLLGQDAPSTATAWLDRLEGLRNETFALPWADADVTGLRQAGADGIPGVISLDQQVDEDHFPGASTPTPTPTGPTASATPGGTASPSDAPTPSDDAPPAAPAPGPHRPSPPPGTCSTSPGRSTTSPGPSRAPSPPTTCPPWRRPARDTTIVSSGNTSAGPDTTVAASERIGDQRVLVSDQGMSALLRDAAGATDQQRWDAAMAELTATMATAARAGSATSPSC